MPMIDQLKKSDIQFIFIFLISVCLGTFVAWLTPPFAIPDEGAHYLRSYEVSRGHWVNLHGKVGVPIPCSEYLVIANQYVPVAFYEASAEKMQPNAKECLVNSKNTAGAYSPVPYIASAFGIGMAENFGYSIQTRLRVGRTANVFVTSLICLLSVLAVQRYRLLLTTLILLPMCIWLRASLSADAMTISITIFYLAYILRLHERKIKISQETVYFLIVLAILMGSMKPVYGLLSFASLILVDCSKPYRDKVLQVIVLAMPGIIAIIIGIIWAISADNSLVFINKFGGADPTLQLDIIANNPSGFVQTIINTFQHNYELFIVQALLPTLGNTRLVPEHYSLVISMILSGIIFFTMVTTPSTLLAWQRIVLFCIAFICLIVVLLPLYLTYTLVGFNEILGLQGRYFLPLIFFVVIGCSVSRPNILFAHEDICNFVAVIMPVIITWSLVTYFYL